MIKLYMISVICLTTCLTSTLYAADQHLGLTEYELACMPCHGVKGKGNGPYSKKLKTPPADLTQIAKSHKGKFPFEEVVKIIDGREMFQAHKDRVMPVWGERYKVSVDPNESKSNLEKTAKRRIEALANYLETIQEK